MSQIQTRRSPLSAARLPTVALIGLGLAGCHVNKPAEKDPDRSVTMYVPTLTPQGGTQMTQSKGGLTISIAPVPYTTTVATQTTWTSRPQDVSTDGFVFRQQREGDPMVMATRTTQSVPVLHPKHLAFLVTVNNQMPRVFHGTGTVVQFNVGGHLLSVDQQLYADLQNAIVPPGNQAQIKISGPDLDELPPGTNSVALFFYDVVTAQNDAGVVTAKENYQWDFALAMTPRAVQVPGSEKETKPMTMSEFQQVSAGTRGPSMRPGRMSAPANPDDLPAPAPAVSPD